jgi:ABC-type Fe3+/spermidine/putrescine transport system ATPase subunit
METTGTEALVVKDLRKNYGKLDVLGGISFSIQRGELVCILGPSGCGKTTVLRIVAGLIPYSGGTVLVEGQDIRKNREPLDDVSVVFQGHAAALSRMPAELQLSLNCGATAGG